METCICDMSALKYWRTPPIVRLLVAGQEDGRVLSKLVRPDELAAFRADLYDSLPLCRVFSSGPQWRKAGDHARALREVFLVLAPSFDGPIEVLATRKNEVKPSTIQRPRLHSFPRPSGTLFTISDDVSICTPELALLQVAPRISRTRLLMIASELCGSFAIYAAPCPIKELLQRISDRGGIPRHGGWSPCLENGRVTNLWTRDPLLIPQDLSAIASAADARGSSKLIEAAGLFEPSAASPLEVQTGLLLGLSRRMGGEGLGGFSFNTRVKFTHEARMIAQKSHCYCDLFWEDAGLDLECQSRMIHDNAGSYISDFERATALEQMGINVLFASSPVINSAARFDALATTVSRKLGVGHRPKTERQLIATQQLRRELFVDWAKICEG